MNSSIRKLLVLICFACVSLATGWCPAQTPAQSTMSQADFMPAWTVPVLRLVSATHVEPTTGVVIAESGLVLVPLEFASLGDEIIVLDGGTDIIRHGRKKKILRRFPDRGLQVLSVETLQRRGAAFSAAPLTDGSRVRLTAFPPAEMIAEGAAPLDIEASLTILDESNNPVISVDTLLPNVSGALLDECGNLAGYSSADGVQSMSTAEAPRYQWQKDLQRIMAEMQLEPRIRQCRQAIDTKPVAEDITPPQVEEAVDEPTQEIPPAESEPEPAMPEADLEPADSPEEELAEETAEEAAPELPDGNLDEMEILPPYEDGSSQAEAILETATDGGDSEQSGLSAWLWLLLAGLLIGAGFFVHHLRNRRSERSAAEADPQPSDEPDTAVDNPDEAGFTTHGLNSTLSITGLMADGTDIDTGCKVSSNAINIIIGRGNADINIGSTTVSRRHASVNGTSEMLTISDLGSSNGTSINGVPCLEGETMYIQPGDLIIVGSCRFSFKITPDHRAAK